MALYSVKKLAAVSGIGETTIRNALKRGELKTGDDGFIDTQAAKTKRWLEQRERNKAKRKGAKKIQVGFLTDTLEEHKGLEQQKLEAEIAYKQEQTLLARQKRARELGLLIDRDIPKRQVADLFARMKLHVLPIGKRTGKRIVEKVQAGATAKEIERYINSEIEQALEKVRGGS
ncbi:MAG: hypothetical protein KDK27_21040 [Leptospiraceae bacterium]|nr:hypothetical protein [Leptospiraceae bacterium]